MPDISAYVGNPDLSIKGIGKAGFCSLCRLTDPKKYKALSALYQRGEKAPAINAWLLANIGKSFDRRTLYNHRDHITHPRDRVVSAVAQRQAQGTLPPVTSEDEFLRAIVTAAGSNLSANPEAVTIDQGIKAATALTAAKQSRNTGINLLVMTLTRGLDETPMLLRSGDEIEGEVVEVMDPS